MEFRVSLLMSLFESHSVYPPYFGILLFANIVTYTVIHEWTCLSYDDLRLCTSTLVLPVFLVTPPWEYIMGAIWWLTSPDHVKHLLLPHIVNSNRELLFELIADVWYFLFVGQWVQVNREVQNFQHKQLVSCTFLDVVNIYWCEPNKIVYRWVNLKAIKRLVEADALKMEIIPNPKVCVLFLIIFLLPLLNYHMGFSWTVWNMSWYWYTGFLINKLNLLSGSGWNQSSSARNCSWCCNSGMHCT